ncbi:hypothetical protein T11_17954 [Trichinella zimbabwensis]|uniref:Integrase zinc-binding domain-containing protein n=1 Tax=Trichinella zimbabwensis TaxID=268475 RepID=A0A0V1I3F3_9BILA|nr:hypothetical protein T11_17954 [Trichinella zimbabwensis]
MVLPSSRKTEVLRELYDNIISRHLEEEKTIEKVMERFCWSGYARDVNPAWIAIEENPLLTIRGHIFEHEACEKRFQKIEMDIFGLLPRSEHRNRYIFLIIDCFTKYEMPEAIRTNQASQFESALFH